MTELDLTILFAGVVAGALLNDAGSAIGSGVDRTTRPDGLG